MSRVLASQADYAECEALHRRFGTTYYFATKQFPKLVQQDVHAVYGFVRVPDEWVDNPGSLTLDERQALLCDWRTQLMDGLTGVTPESGVMRAFVQTLQNRKIPLEEPLVFLDAMEMDLTVGCYDTYADLQTYMRGSASAVGVMMLSVLEDEPTTAKREAAMLLGEAMQMTNFLRDIAEDLTRDRIYVPLEDMDRFGVSVDQLRAGVFDARLERLMRFEIDRTRALYSASDEGIRQLSRSTQRAVLLARVLYSQILDRIEAQGCNPFAGRARTSSADKLLSAARVVLAPGRTLDALASRQDRRVSVL